jgi:hypothetical protein
MNNYPAACLLPRPSYRLLIPPHKVGTGWVLRRTDGKNVFAPAADGRQVIQDPKQLCDRPKRLSDGLSVNLWGHFAWEHSGWVPGTKEAKVKLATYWQPLQPTEPPTVTEMDYSLPSTWDVVGFDISKLDGCSFNLTEFGLITASVCHAPNCWNYWHYEVRFQDAFGQWLDRLNDYDPVPYKNKKLERLQNNLLASFIQAGLAQPVIPTSPPTPLVRSAYDTQP